ncbi:MAG: VWA domain-containing protein [Myxococcota bacterium]|nr:VWA domain-containing protein [Myxococcota bacterium]
MSDALQSRHGVLLGFFYALRSRGLKVTPTQWLTVIEGLCLGLHAASLLGFYSMARAILVKDESELDDFDLVFAAHFQGMPEALRSIEQEIFDWLETPVAPYPIDPQWRQTLEQVDIEALRTKLEERLAQQKERHDGGSHWVGTGGTSAFGHSGFHPGGIRVGGQERLGTAVQVAAQRRFREHRRDQVLETRQMGVALKKLRALSREGQAEELDLEATIEASAKAAGELELVFTPPRHNAMSLLLAMDVGGSMEPYRRMVDALFSAAHAIRHFKRFEHVYFHNCIYERVYQDAAFEHGIPLSELQHRFDRDTRLVLVGDAHMYPGELTQRWGALSYYDQNEKPGLAYLALLRDHFKAAAWLNPMDERWWEAPSTRLVRQVFPMYPLTVAGVADLVKNLAKA